MAKNDVTFSKIELKVAGGSYVNILNQFQSSSVFGGASFNEGLFEPGISGFIILNDPDPSNTTTSLPTISNLAKTGSMIRFTFSTSVLGSLDARVEDLEFYVYNVSVVSDLSPGIATLGSSQTVTYRLEFSSYESSAINYESTEVLTWTNDYVSSISDFVSIITSSTDGPGTALMGPSNEETEFPNTAQIEPEIFPTFNGMWLKLNQSLYPWGKEKTIPTINTLIQASLNYAIPTVGRADDDDGEEVDPGVAQETNPSYVFYQSMPYGQWHFVPIGGEIQDNITETQSLYNKNYINGSENEGYHTYRFTMDETVGKRIELFKIIKDTDVLELEEAGAFGSRYRLIEPNYRGIYNGINLPTDEDDNEGDVHDKKVVGMPTNTYYHDAMSIATHLQQDDVVYHYDDFFDEDDNETNPLLGKRIESGRENPAFGRLVDTVYGYFDTSYLYKPFPTKNDDYASSRLNKYMWQTMFDMTDIPYKFNSKTGELGADSIVAGRYNVEKGRLAYAVLSDLKEQWNRYRHSICCSSAGGGDNFLALLVGATNAAPPVGEDEQAQDYDRNIIPFGFTGNTLDNLYRYSFVEVEVWPKVLVSGGATLGGLGIEIEGVSADTLYYDYLGTKDINPSTGEHEIFFAGNSAGSEEGITLTFGLPESNEESGQEYNISQDQELFVIPVDGGRRGLFTAYNTMELTNNKAFTGAGINTKGFNYPSGFSLVPIGGMTSGGSVGEGSTPIPKQYMGSIVEMSSLNSADLNTIRTDTMEDSFTPDEGRRDDDSTADLGSGPNAVVGLLNTILGTDNLPTTFGGGTAELTYIDPDTNQPTSFVRDDKDERDDITENAKPAPEKGVLESSNTTVYLFTAENDHDGKCSE